MYVRTPHAHRLTAAGKEPSANCLRSAPGISFGASWEGGFLERSRDVGFSGPWCCMYHRHGTRSCSTPGARILGVAWRRRVFAVPDGSLIEARPVLLTSRRSYRIVACFPASRGGDSAGSDEAHG